MNDVLIVSYDKVPGDRPCLSIGRKNAEDRPTDIIKVFYGETADDLYQKLTEKPNKITWGDIYREFLQVTNIDSNAVSDYRPYPSENDFAIIVWLKNGTHLVYHHPCNQPKT